jgi:hypothetical protein
MKQALIATFNSILYRLHSFFPASRSAGKKKQGKNEQWQF